MRVSDALALGAVQEKRVAAGEQLSETELALARLAHFIKATRDQCELVHREEEPRLLVPYWFLRGDDQ